MVNSRGVVKLIDFGCAKNCEVLMHNTSLQYNNRTLSIEGMGGGNVAMATNFTKGYFETSSMLVAIATLS